MFVSCIRLLIIDDIHLLHDDRGSVIESLVARTLRQVGQCLCRLIIDEVHLLHDDRGSVIESLVARTLRQVGQCLCRLSSDHRQGPSPT